MAEFVELDDKGEIEAVEQLAEQKPEPVEAKPEIPEKYRGKVIDDIVKMHQEAEKTLSRQGQELGEVRRLADELLKSQLEKKAEKEKPVEVDFFENPKEAIRQAVESNPKVLQAEQYALQAQREHAKQALIQKHPDAFDVIKSDKFREFVNSDVERINQFQRADAYDANAAISLVSTFKQLEAVKQQKVAEIDTKARDKTLKAAEIDSGGSGESSRKVYRRADLIRLKMRDPSRYDAMADEIMAAYSEGRVR